MFCILTSACTCTTMVQKDHPTTADPGNPSVMTTPARQLLPAFENGIAEALFQRLDDELLHRAKLGRTSDQILSTHWPNIKKSVDPNLLSYEHALIWQHLQRLEETGALPDDVFDYLGTILPKPTDTPRGDEFTHASNVAKQLYLSSLNSALITILPQARDILRTEIETLPTLSIALQSPGVFGDRYDVASATSLFDLTGAPRRDLTQSASQIMFHGVPGAHLINHKARWQGIQGTPHTRAHRRGWALYMTDKIIQVMESSPITDGHHRFFRRQVLLAMIDHGMINHQWSDDDATSFLLNQGIETDDALYMLATARQNPGDYLDTLRGYRELVDMENRLRDQTVRFRLTDYLSAIVRYGPVSLAALRWHMSHSFRPEEAGNP